MEMFHPKYLFLTYSMDGMHWWTFNSENDTNCSEMDYTKVLQYSLQVLPFRITTENENEDDEELLVSGNLQKTF